MIKKLLTITFLSAMATLAHCQKNWETNPVNTLEISMDNIKEIDISFHEEKVSVLQGTGSKLVVKEYRNKNDSNFFARIEHSGGKLSIKRGGWLSWRIFYLVRSRIEIYVPATYKNTVSMETTSGKIDLADNHSVYQINIKTVSGKVFVNQLITETANISATSGDIHIENLTSNNATVKTTSGDIAVNQTTGNMLAKCTSGDIYCKNASRIFSVSTTSGKIVFDSIAGEISARSTSGRIKFNCVNGGLTAHSTSGSIRCTFDKNIENITLATTSGSIMLDLPKDRYNFLVTTTSGKISTPLSDNVPGTKLQQIITENGKSDKNITLKTISGAINVMYY
ncbi:MAG: DUF4097 domain-containing protein [Prevotellaceae bacterium]|jgi:hypothetical protein|nr:DUF4097 domain-containing protein [Prevotellaceae bacterium]